jgi:hypothetical protein
MASARMNVKKVSVTDLRDSLKDRMQEARNNQVLLIENRRRQPKYLVDKEFLDEIIRERESILATLEILSDRDLTNRLLSLSSTIDEDVAAGKLLSMADVFGK